MRERNPAGYRRWLNGDPGWSGGESYDDMHRRVVDTVQRLLDAHPRGRILVVSHGGAVRAIVAHAAGLPRHDRRHIDGAGNCSLTTVDHRSPIAAAGRVQRHRAPDRVAGPLLG